MPEIDEPVHLSVYRDNWPVLFDSERSRLAMVLELSTEPFQHIGSTAVPGLIAKPIIDIMLGIPDLALSRQYTETLSGLGYEDLGEAGVPGRRYYRRRSDSDFNLHIVEINGMHWISNIALRDFLRNDSVARERYREAKLAAVAAGANTLLAYSKLKGPVIQAFLIQALPKGTI
jgi:GrpB-like predicted nucleotidyltransferase (UPF0157 family)